MVASIGSSSIRIIAKKGREIMILNFSISSYLFIYKQNEINVSLLFHLKLVHLALNFKTIYVIVYNRLYLSKDHFVFEPMKLSYVVNVFYYRI